MAEEEDWLVVSVVACLLLRTVSSWSYVFLPRGFIVQIEIHQEQCLLNQFKSEKLPKTKTSSLVKRQ